jgi:hypothetical protein
MVGLKITQNSTIWHTTRNSVQEGSLKITVVDKTSKETVTVVLGQGGFVGEGEGAPFPIALLFGAFKEPGVQHFQWVLGRIYEDDTHADSLVYMNNLAIVANVSSSREITTLRKKALEETRDV